MYLQVFRRRSLVICDLNLIQTQQRNTKTIQAAISVLRRGIHIRHHIRMTAMSPTTDCSAMPKIRQIDAIADASSPLSTFDLPPSKLLRFNNIIKSQQDNRDYRGLHLENGLKVLLCSDPATDKAAASLAVGVGYMNDPDHIPGLAHFCEHMLFLGTKKYPNENAYSTFLAENGGISNAATYADSTKYYFDVVPAQLDGALDRFAQFFIAPLFTESMTEREIKAVCSEHEKNLATDAWRIRQVVKAQCDQRHPYAHFGTGNKETLSDNPERGVVIRDELIKFHGRWYSADIMCLSVYGKESMDVLEAMVLDKFAGIVNKNVRYPMWTDSHPFGKDTLGKRLTVIPIKDSRSLTISFPTGNLDQFYKSAPEQYLSNLLGHESQGSILSELKRKGWSNSLMAGQNSGARGFGFFDVTVDLTKDGINHVDEVINTIFQYISMLKRDGIHQWLYEENRMLWEMSFRFKDKETPLSLVSNIVHIMQLYPLEEVFSGPYLVTEWRPDLIRELLDSFSPRNCRALVVGQAFADKATLTEKWYGTKYGVENFGASAIESWSRDKDINEALFVPPPNPFIPTDFALAPIESGGPKHPTILYDTPMMRVWFKQDTEFLKPKTIMGIDFTSPLAYSDPLNCNLTHMFVQLFKDHLNEYTYEASVAGLQLGVNNTASGISLTIGGYSHKQQILLQNLLDELFNFKFKKERFEIYKEQLLRSLNNYKTEQPYQHAVYYLALILTEQAWTKQELADAVSLVTPERLKQFIVEFMSRMHVETFLHGNVDKQRALDLTGIIEQKMLKTNSATLPLLSRQLLLKREYKLPTGEHYLFETDNEFHKSSCAELYLQCGVQNDRSNTFIDLTSQILTEPCYSQLRTKEQLGYIVFCGARKANGVQGIRIIVQSVKHPAIVEERIESFLDSMESTLEAMSDDEFQRHKDAVAAHKLEKPKYLATQFSIYQSEILLQQYHFERPEAEVAVLKTITKAEYLGFYRSSILRQGSARNGLSIHIVSTAEGGVGNANTEKSTEQPKERAASVRLITDLAQFKSSKELYPIGQPYIHVQPKGGRSKL